MCLLQNYSSYILCLAPSLSVFHDPDEQLTGNKLPCITLLSPPTPTPHHLRTENTILIVLRFNEAIKYQQQRITWTHFGIATVAMETNRVQMRAHYCNLVITDSARCVALPSMASNESIFSRAE